jgi:GTP-binding protein EngB required for normal cell division
MDSKLKDFYERRLLLSSKIIKVSELIETIESSLQQKGTKFNTSIGLSSIILRNQSQSLLDEKFKIMVVGEFSSGKSTFLNALIKDNILPVAVRPTTATINLIKYSEEKKILLHYWGNTDEVENELDEGIIKEIGYDQLAEFSTSLTKEYDSNSTQIKYIEIFSPTDYCRNGVEILDTPGLSSTNKNHDKVTLSYLPNGHTAIMLLNPSQPLSRSERDYLRIIRSYLNRVIFVANKINLLDEEEQETALQYMIKELQKEMETDKEIVIYPLNAKLAAQGDWTKSNFNNFVSDFESFLISNEKAKEFVLPPVINSINTIKQYVTTLEQLISVTTFSSGEFDKQIQLYSQKLEELKKKKIQVMSYLHDNIGLLLNRFEFTINNAVQIRLNEITMSLLKITGNEAEELKTNMAGFVNEEINKLLISIQDMVEKETTDFQKDVLFRFNELLTDLNQAELILHNKPNEISESIALIKEPLQLTDKQGEKNILLSMGAGVGTAVIAISAIGGALGIAIGFFGGKFIAKYISKNIKSNDIHNLTSALILKLNEEFTKSIPAATQNFKTQLDHICETIESKIEGLISLSNNKVIIIRAQLKESEEEVLKRRQLFCGFREELNELKKFFDEQYSELNYV